jgi:hypothetical protein
VSVFAFLIRPRSGARAGAVALGLVFMSLAFLHLFRESFATAAEFAAVGSASVLAGVTLPERWLIFLGQAAVVVNVLAAAVVIVSGVRIQ